MRRVTAVSVAAVLLVTGCASGEKTTDRGTGTGAIVNGSASRLRSALEGMLGKPVVVNYWATWCDPCKAEMPRLVAAARRYKGRIGFLGVDVEDDRSAARAFVKRYGVSFTSLAMSKTEVQRTQDILGLPVTQFYRSDGELAFVHQGEIKADDLEEKLDELLRIGRPVG